MAREESGVGGGAVVQESTAMLREWGRMLRWEAIILIILASNLTIFC